MKYLTLLAVLFASAFQLTSAAARRTTSSSSSIDVSGYGPSDSRGFRLDKRERSARKQLPSETIAPEGEHHEYMQSEDSDYDLRRWKEEDYEALMNAMSGNNGGLRYYGSKMRQLRGSTPPGEGGGGVGIMMG